MSTPREPIISVSRTNSKTLLAAKDLKVGEFVTVCDPTCEPFLNIETIRFVTESGVVRLSGTLAVPKHDDLDSTIVCQLEHPSLSKFNPYLTKEVSVAQSRYKNKQKGRNPKKVKVFAKVGPVFDYTSTCHSAPATKKPCAMGNGEPDDKGYYQSPLGSWNCSICRKKCKVTRTRRKEEEVGTTTETSPIHLGVSLLDMQESIHASV